MRYVDYYHILRDIRKKGLTFDLVHTNTGITDLGYFLAKHWKVPHVWHSREFGKEDYRLRNCNRIYDGIQIGEPYQKNI